MNDITRINTYLLWKLPAAFLCGVRAIYVDSSQCSTTVKHRWINQNPFHSMYFAVQAMAAELSTGVLITMAKKSQPGKISTLVTSVRADFHKKATGRITFTCLDGKMIQEAFSNLGDNPQTIVLKSSGKNSEGEIVSLFEITWSIKLRQS